MTKRIISGLFILVALGLLGLILAGALTSGEQLLVRFFTAVIVAGLGLYLISDLRLQADEEAEAARQRQRNRTATNKPTVGAKLRDTGPPPPNSTVAYMATVTGKSSGTRTVDSPPEDPPAVPIVNEAIFDPDDRPVDDLRTDDQPIEVLPAMTDTRDQISTTPVIDLRQVPPPCPPEIENAIRSGVLKIVSQLIAEGRLSAGGPITDRDVRTMVYVAFTASELRKILLAGGTIDGDNSSIDLGRVELLPAPEPALKARLAATDVPPSPENPFLEEGLVSVSVSVGDCDPSYAR